MIDLIIETKQRKVYDIKARDEAGEVIYDMRYIDYTKQEAKDNAINTIKQNHNNAKFNIINL